MTLDHPVRGPVLFIHASDEAYGADRTLFRQMLGLHERGWGVRLILPDDIAPGWLSAAAGGAGIPVERRPIAVARRRYLRWARIPRYIVMLVRARRMLRTVIDAQRPAIVHVNTSAVLVGAILGRPAGIRLVWHIHEIIVRPRSMAWLFRALPVLTADRVITVSDAVRAHLVQGHRRKVITVRNGIDPRDPSPLPALDPGEGPLVAFVGRLNRWKGYEIFVEAAALVVARFPSTRFVIAGDPPAGESWRTADLDDRIARAGLTGNVRTLGFVVDGSAVFDAADIAVVPSTWPEPFGLVIIEAMQSGCAVIATDHGGAPEIIEPGTGILVRPGDPVALADAICALLVDPERRAAMGAAGRARVATEFNTARMVDGLEQVFTRLLG